MVDRQELGEPVPPEMLPDAPQQGAAPQVADDSQQGEPVPAEMLPATDSTSDDSNLGEPVPPENMPGAEDHTSGLEQLKAGAEGLAQGFFSKPLTTAYETKLLGVDPKDIAAREAANPGIHTVSELGGLAGGLFTGVGELGILSKGAEAVAHAAEIGKVGGYLIKGIINAGGAQALDEYGKGMLGQGDPEAPLSAALTHIGAASLLGAAGEGLFGLGSNLLKYAGETKIGGKISQYLQDFGNRVQSNQLNPDRAEAVYQELKDFHGSLMDGQDAIYGPAAMKNEAINANVPANITPEIQKQSAVLNDTLSGMAQDMFENTRKYPAHLQEGFADLVSDWQKVTQNPASSPADVFNATQKLKQQLAVYSKFGKKFNILDPQYAFVNDIRDIHNDLKTSLEDTGVWGKAGNIQAKMNSAYSKFQDPLADFRSKFMHETNAGGDDIDAGKVNTYINTLGKPNGKLRNEVLQRYLTAAEEYKNQIANIHENVGVESPFPPTSLNATNEALNGPLSSGAKHADILMSKLVPSFAEKIAGQAGRSTIGGIGGVEGARAGYDKGGIPGALFGGVAGAALGSVMLPKLAQLSGQAITKYAGPAALRMASEGKVQNFLQGLDHANAVSSGAQKINRALASLFDKDVAGPISTLVPTSSYLTQREKVKKYLAKGGLNSQIQNEMATDNRQPTNTPSPAPQQAYAEGGEVKQSPPQPSVATQAAPKQSALPDIFPEQAMMLQQAKGRVANYLNSLRPQPAQGLPFDHVLKDDAKERTYNHAIDIANNPLSVVHKIKEGSLHTEHVQHLNALYPEVYDHLKKKMTEKLAEAQVKGKEPPSHKIRQGMSLFLGSPVDSTFTPSAIVAAQSTFAPPQGAPQTPTQPQSNPKKSMNSLNKLPSQYQTMSQAADSDRSKRK